MCMTCQSIISPRPQKNVNAEEKFHGDKKDKTFSNAHVDHPGGEGWITLYFLQRLTWLFDVTPTLAKHHGGIWQKAVFVFLSKKSRSKPVALSDCFFFLSTCYSFGKGRHRMSSS